MKKFLLPLIFISVMIFSCKPQESILYSLHGERANTEIMNAENYSLNRLSFNNLCKDSVIPNDLSKWKSLSLRDFETHQTNIQYIFIKNKDKRDIISKITYSLRLMINNTDTVFNLNIRKISE